MTPDEIDQLRQQLEAEKAEYEETLGTSLESAKGEELDQQRVGRLSRMDALQSQSILRAANQRIAGEIQQIDLALERIKRGTYGKCHSCERAIGLARLQALPATLHCVACARRGG
jgi:DnaK suppressor protein